MGSSDSRPVRARPQQIMVYPNAQQGYQQQGYPPNQYNQPGYQNVRPQYNQQQMYPPPQNQVYSQPPPPPQAQAQPNRSAMYPDMATFKNSSANIRTVPINDDTIKRFVEIQAQIDTFEKQGVFDNLRIAEEDFQTLEKSKRQAEINNKVLQEQTKKEKQDLDNIQSPTVQAFFKNQGDYTKAISKEQQEYLHCVNLLEISNNELKALTIQHQASKEKLEKFKLENQKAIDLYNEQMTILYSVFDGSQGSELENRLEKEVKEAEARKDQLTSALYKWSNSRFLLVYAYNQLQNSETTWSSLMKMAPDNKEKVLLATEVRNNLVAANQNLINTKNYLKNIELPYCTEQDLKTLQSLAACIYQDMTNAERQKYFLELVITLRKRLAGLNQWFDQVIKDSLVVDYKKAKEEYTKKAKELKAERIRLMQEKIKEKTGKDVKINLIDVSDNKKDEVNLDNFINSSLKTGENQDKKQEKIEEKPIAASDLPPPPSQDQILGNIEAIKRQYLEQVHDWNNHLDASRRDADEKLQKMLEQYNKK